MDRSRAAAILCGALLLSTAASAQPYIPADAATVIERLPAAGGRAGAELRELRRQLAAAPDRLEQAAPLARRFIDIGRREGDPRYLGYAEAALAPWWTLPQPPDEVRVLRAVLLQSRHRFSEALADLDAVLRSRRPPVQAWLTRASILQVQGHVDEARRSCARLVGQAPDLVTIACIAQVGSLSGSLDKSAALLRQAIDRNPEADTSTRLWALTLLAEMAVRQGDDAGAEARFRQALAQGAPDTYLLGAYADFLLDRQREAEVLALLKNGIRADALLLRYALALQAHDLKAAEPHIASLAARFAAARQRGDTIHGREQARFELHLRNAPEAALATAQKNWESQKEPADARILLEAALASGKTAAAQPVLRWMQRTRIEDRVLAALVQRLGASS